MASCKVTPLYCLFRYRFVYHWTILILISGYCFPSLAGPVASREMIQSGIARDGSGHGGLLDNPATTDDDYTDSDSSSLYDHEVDVGGGGDDGGGSASMPGMTTIDSSDEIDHLEVRCFFCHGDGKSGCDVAAMLHDPQTFSVTCFGKCLNLSSGSTSVYDCAHDMATRNDKCLKNGDTEMCFCSGDFCNGHPDSENFSVNSKNQYYLHVTSLQLGRSNDYVNKHFYDKDREAINIGHNSDIYEHFTNGSRGSKSSRGDKNAFSGDNRNDNIKAANTIFRSQHLLGKFTESKNRPPLPVKQIFKTGNNVISEFSFHVNFTSEEATTQRTIEMNELRVGTLKVNAGNCVNSLSNVLLLVCSVFLVVHIYL